MWQTSQTHNNGKYDNNGRDGYFRFDDDNNMSYRYIFSITNTDMGQLNIYINMVAFIVSFLTDHVICGPASAPKVPDLARLKHSSSTQH